MYNHSELVSIFANFLASEQVISCSSLRNGFSNDNFLIHTQQGDYLLKCYKTHWPALSLRAQKDLSRFDICPAPLWLDSINQRAIFDYIKGDTAQQLSMERLVPKLAKIHSYHATTPPMDIANELLFYRQSSVYIHYEHQIDDALNLISTMPVQYGYCHNDLIKDNIIVNTSGVYLIDFEYAKTNDVYFDLAALSVSFELNTDDEIRLLQLYATCSQLNEAFVTSTSKLNCYKMLFLILCIAWYEQRNITNQSVKLRAQLDKLNLCVRV